MSDSPCPGDAAEPPAPTGIAPNDKHVFIVESGRRLEGRVKVLSAADCPGCLRPLKVGGWGYPNPCTDDRRLHHYRCCTSHEEITRRAIAIGRTRQSGLPRGVTNARSTGHCLVCPHPIRPGHLIEVQDRRHFRHVLCPGLCVRCETPIERGQPFAPRMSKAGSDENFGWKHQRCDWNDLQAKQQRDAEANTARQRKLTQRRATRGRGSQPPTTAGAPPEAEQLPRHPDKPVPVWKKLT